MTTLQPDPNDPIWSTIHSYLTEENIWMIHQIDGFHDFVETNIPHIVEKRPPLTIWKDIKDDPVIRRVKCELSLSSPEFGLPYIMDPDHPEQKNDHPAATTGSQCRPLYPYESRMRNVSYQFPMTIQVSYTLTYYGVSEVPVAATGPVPATGSVPLASLTELPHLTHTHSSRELFTHLLSMTHSRFCSLHLKNRTPDVMEPLGECYLDDGGYFILNGNEKVAIAQEKMCDNRVYLFDQKNNNKFSHVAEIRSFDPNTQMPNIMQIRIHSSEMRSKVIRWRTQRRQTVIGSKKTGIRSLGGQIVVKVSHVKKDIPLFILMKAMAPDHMTDEDLIHYILGPWRGHDRENEYLELLWASADEAQECVDRQACLMYILEKFTVKLVKENPLQYVEDFFEKKVFPQYGNQRMVKLQYLAYCVRQLLDVILGYRRYSDRDHYGNKRVECTGVLLTQLFIQLYDRYMKDLKMAIHKELSIPHQGVYPQLYKLIKSSMVEKSLKYALSTGNWNMKRSPTQNEKRKGVAQVLSRMTYVSTLSHLRRINTPMENKSGKLVRPRQLHSSHKGFVCPAETPEGQPVGLVKNLSLFSVVTSAFPEEWLYPLLDEMQVLRVTDHGRPAVGVAADTDSKYDDADMTTTATGSFFVPLEWLGPEMMTVFINGILYGYLRTVHQSIALQQAFREYRRCGRIPHQSSIVVHLDRREIFLYTDAGRVIRPLFVLDPQEQLPWEYDPDAKTHWNQLQWKEMILRGYVEFVDAEEMETVMVCASPRRLHSDKAAATTTGTAIVDGSLIRPRYTHCEIHPIGMLGIIAAMIPFPDHNQSPRNSYQSAMGKQCISMYTTNVHQRMDTVSNILFHPERPLVTTRLAPYVHTNELPYGQNIVLAFGIYTSYNEEDAIIMNQSALDRGLFHALSLKTYKSEERKHNVSVAEEKFCRPDRVECKGKRFGCYDKLDDRGMAQEGSFVTANDVIIGKITPQGSRSKKMTYRDSSVTVKASDTGTVDKVFLSTNQESYRIAKIRIRADREPVLGDKFAARYGQKGTVGMLYRQEDMPFMSDGTPIDVMVNPHSIPSRMTIGMLLEILIGKASVQTGVFYDGTPFESNMTETMEVYESILHQHGIQKKGWERLYNGVTGEWMDALIFVGPCHYQRLKHMVVDKLHSRSRGPVAPLTRQPCEGRSRSGGLRLGEMERDVLLAHGASHFLQERLFNCSDAFYVYVCDDCGLTIPIHEGPIQSPDLYINQCCKVCKNYTRFSKVTLPYASKCLFTELQTMGIVPRIEPENAVETAVGAPIRVME